MQISFLHRFRDLAGRGEDIKAISIGMDVFNKDADFDPGQDALVRINA